MLTTHKNDGHRVLLDVLGALKNKANSYYAMHFRFSELMEHYKTEYQMKITANIANDLLRDGEGSLVVIDDHDIFIICKGAGLNVMKKLIFQLRYLYMDDPLAYNDEGEDNERFCQIYDLKTEWQTFFPIARQKFKDIDSLRPPEKVKMKKSNEFTPEKLVSIEGILGKTNVAQALRRQSVCASKNGEFKTVFSELYVNMSALSDLLKAGVDLVSNRWLFKYLTEMLDIRMLELLGKSPVKYLSGAVSVNINIKTLLSENFTLFDERLDDKIRKKIIIEIHIADIFNNMKAFVTAREMLQKQGYRICLDGMDSLGFLQIDRNSLGFDLAKIHWNADEKSDAKSEENKALRKAIEKCGSSRLILSRCDNKEAVEYGQLLGISLFQGRYLDSVLDPDSEIVN